MSFALLEDIDADGVSELCIGEPWWRAPGSESGGRIAIVSGRTGKLLRSIDPTPEARLFGFAIAADVVPPPGGAPHVFVSSPYMIDWQPTSDVLAKPVDRVWQIDAISGERKRSYSHGECEGHQNGDDIEHVFGTSIIGGARVGPHGDPIVLIASTEA